MDTLETVDRAACSGRHTRMPGTPTLMLRPLSHGTNTSHHCPSNTGFLLSAHLRFYCTISPSATVLMPSTSPTHTLFPYLHHPLNQKPSPHPPATTTHTPSLLPVQPPSPSDSPALDREPTSCAPPRCGRCQSRCDTHYSLLTTHSQGSPTPTTTLYISPTPCNMSSDFTLFGTFSRRNYHTQVYKI